MNSNKKKSLILALAGTLILAGVTTSWAQGRNQTGSDDRRARIKARMDDRIQQMHSQLGLSPEQQQKLKSHREKKRGNRKALREKMRTKRQELQMELQKPNIDRQRVRTIHNEIKQLMTQSADERLDSIIYVREVLTPEQFDAFMKKKEEFRERRGKRRDKGAVRNGRMQNPRRVAPDEPTDLPTDF